MSLSAEQIAWLEKTEPTYGHSGDELNGLSLSCFSAPSRTGKSRIIQKIVELAKPNDEVGEVNTITPRERRDDDPVGYRTGNEGITNEWMIEQIENHTLVNWKLFETGDIYGTDRTSYPAKHNLLPTQVGAIPMLSRAAFASMHIVYIVRPIDDWKKHLPENLDDPKQRGRIIEAKKSLEYARNGHGIIRVVNYEDDILLERTSRGLLEIVTTQQQDYSADILEGYHEREFEIHRHDMENHVDELLRKAGANV